MSYPTYPNTFKKEITVGDKVVHVEIGKYSEQADAAVLLTCGGTTVHATIALGRKVDLGYFPLSVEYQEKLFAGGIIKGSRWVKRDGRPTDAAILKGRVIDRTMRPMFPEGLTHEVQVIITVFSTDKENTPDMLGLLATGIGLSISSIPFDGPVAGLRVGFSKADGKFVFNPTETEQKTMDMDLIVSGSGEAIVMVEAGANEVGEETILEAFDAAQTELAKLCTEITAIAKEIGREKQVLVPVIEKTEQSELTEKTTQEIAKKYAKEIREMVKLEGVLKPSGMTELIFKIVSENQPAEGQEPGLMSDPAFLKAAFGELMTKDGREMIMKEKMRPDGRKTDEIRPIWCEVDIFSQTHGSAMFKRGATQVLSVTTLGSPAKAQLVEDINGEEEHYYIHHYDMPPYASGEAGRVGSPKRREIGHGALAERALVPVLPPQSEFPYTIQVVSNVVSSNGSTSQGSICGSTMSLMAAGVPIKRPVAGIAMGLMSDGKDYVVLSDIQGLEDHIGDMDFKVAGTSEGVTALQMDIKIKGIPPEVMKLALRQAKVGRMHIMGKMLEVIAEPRKSLAPTAPKIQQISIPADRIGELIGPGGKMIKSIIEMTGAEIEVSENEDNTLGLVNIGSSDQAKVDHAVAYISNMMRSIEVGEEFDGEVVRIESYGAFVNIAPGRDGLVHVSAMATDYVQDANDIVTMGEKVHVRVAEIQDDGKIKLTMLTPEQESESAEKRRSSGGGDRGGDRGGFSGRRDGGRPSFGGGRGGDRGGDRGGFRGGRR
ncbi:polyribonucleotide nucleotidyltransferase [soil metagenome]